MMGHPISQTVPAYLKTSRSRRSLWDVGDGEMVAPKALSQEIAEAIWVQ